MNDVRWITRNVARRLSKGGFHSLDMDVDADFVPDEDAAGLVSKNSE
jgi:hypothetical protein